MLDVYSFSIILAHALHAFLSVCLNSINNRFQSKFSSHSDIPTPRSHSNTQSQTDVIKQIHRVYNTKREGFPAVRDILKAGLDQNNYKKLHFQTVHGGCARSNVCVHTRVRLPPSPLVGSKWGSTSSFAHIALMSHVLFNTWQLLMSKGSGDLEAVCGAK